MTLLEELKYRGFIKDFTDEKGLTDLLAKEKIRFYCGFDPTADSLHVGHLIPILIMKHFQKHHHKPIAVVGGGTGLIGDPSGRKNERELLTLQKSIENSEGIKKQLARFLDFEGEDKALLVNNYDWLKDISVVEFLRDYGKNFTINYMLSKDVVASRLEQGISFTEFSYMIMQALDYLHLFETKNCTLQIGGQDQWGNITSGIELIRKKTGKEVYAFTMPLLTKADGTKFGKSEGNAIWLDKEKTTPYEMYQFFLNVEDEKVIDYLKYLTFLSKEEIDALAYSHEVEPHLRCAHKALAKDVITFLHGSEAYHTAVKISEALFSGDIKHLTKDEIEQAIKGIPTMDLASEISLVDLLVDGTLCSSKREAREMIHQGSITLNGEKVTDDTFRETKGEQRTFD